MTRNDGYWFPAKRYGWGWGLPIVWQGWAVLIGWFAVVLGTLRLLTPAHPIIFGLFFIVMLVFLVWVHYRKGEPPSWRWGD